MSSYSQPRGTLSFQQALGPFLTGQGLPFAEVLSPAEVEQAFADEGVAFGTTKNSVFTPALTLWAFLSQAVSKAKACRDAVLRVVVLLIALHRDPCSLDTGDYCRARAKLPTVVIRRLTMLSGQRLEDQVPNEWLWHGRHVKLVDGTTVTLPDTSENQKAYPQLDSQEAGLGFPIVAHGGTTVVGDGGAGGHGHGTLRGQRNRRDRLVPATVGQLGTRRHRLG